MSPHLLTNIAEFIDWHALQCTCNILWGYHGQAVRFMHVRSKYGKELVRGYADGNSYVELVLDTGVYQIRDVFCTSED